MATKSKHRGQILVLFTLMSAVFFGFAGLAMDIVYVFTVRAMLVTAVDAASLAGAREIAGGSTAVANAVNRTFVTNFPDGALLTEDSGHGAPGIETGPGWRRVVVDGSATVPTVFMRFFGWDSLDITASATAIRRDINMVLVLDRSGSMSRAAGFNPGPTSFEDLQWAAGGFVDRFDESRDKFGLVSFGTTSNVDFAPATSFNASVKSLINQMISDNSGTNSADGIWRAYNALNTLAEPEKLNVIVFFTDGAATTFSGTFNVTGGSCSGQQRTGTVAGFSSSTSTAARGVRILSAGAPPVSYTDETYLTGCGFGDSTDLSNRVARLPMLDLHGASLTAPRTIPAWSNGFPLTRGDVIRVAAGNATINVAETARNADMMIFVIGLGGNAPPPEIPLDVDLLLRVSNSDATANPNYNRDQPTGKVLIAPTPRDLEKTFDQMASEVLRLVE